MLKPLRLGISGSCFIYAMPQELLARAYGSTKTQKPAKFDERLNGMMVDFMRDMMSAMNTMDVDAMECYHSVCWDNERVMEVIEDNPRVEFWSVHAPYGRYMDPSSPLEEARDGAVEAYCDAVSVAKRLGAKVIVAHPGANVDYGMPRQMQLDLVVDTMKKIADFAGECGVKVAIEPLPKNEPGNTLDQVLWIIEQVDRPNVGMNFDVNHLFPAEEIPALIRKAGSRILSVHISDQDGVERHWMPFEGKLDWSEVLAALVETGYRGPLMYEAHVHDVKACADVGKAIIENYKRLIALAPEVASDRGAQVCSRQVSD